MLYKMCIVDKIPLPEGCNSSDHGHIRAECFIGNFDDGINVRLRLIKTTRNWLLVTGYEE